MSSPSPNIKQIRINFTDIVVIVFLLIFALFLIRYIGERETMKKIIARLEADSRIAEVIVTDVVEDKQTGKQLTTIKFLEYDVNGIPLIPKYFTFSGNIIQFQSLVARFADDYIKQGVKGKDRSVYLFMKAFVLDGKNTEEHIITNINDVPEGYKLLGAKGSVSTLETKIWKKFWQYALSSSEAAGIGIKNAQIEAPGTKFVPGMIYTLKIEHDGGIRIDARAVPAVLRGEKT